MYDKTRCIVSFFSLNCSAVINLTDFKKDFKKLNDYTNPNEGVSLKNKTFKNPLEDNATSRQPFTSRTFHPRN